MGKNSEQPLPGHKWGRPDLDRIGLFGEADYVSTAEPFLERKNDRLCDTFLSYRRIGKQFINNPAKRGHDTRDAYFNKEYNRVFESEPYTDLVVIRRKERLKAKEKNIVNVPFKPSSVAPKPSGSGSMFGTIEQQWPLPKREIHLRPEEPHQKPESKRNFLTRPPKQGSGYGYQAVTIGKPFDYMTSPYDAALLSIRKDHEIHKKKVIGERAFVSSIRDQEYFNIFAGIAGTPGKEGAAAPGESAGEASPPPAKKESTSPNTVPFKPSSGIGYTINKYPTYDPPAGAPIPGSTTGQDPPPKAQPKKLGPIFRPSGITKSYPITSIVAANCPIRCPVWLQDSLTTSLGREIN